jgi:FixJ family two-component response regulator
MTVRTSPHSQRWKVERPPDCGEVDEMAVDRVVRGSYPYPVLSESDLPVAWRRLEADGKSARQIAVRLHVATRTVTRWRKREREKAKST